MNDLLKALARLNAAKQTDDFAAVKDLFALADWNANCVRCKVLKIAFDMLVEEAQ